MGDAHAASHGQQLVFAVEQGELAAVAGGKLPHRQGRQLFFGHHSSRTLVSGSARAHSTTGPSRQTSIGPSWQCPHQPTPQRMLRSSDTRTRSAGMPWATRAWAVNRIITSGPQTNAVLLAGSTRAPGSSEVTTPTWPAQPSSGRSTVTATSTP